MKSSIDPDTCPRMNKVGLTGKYKLIVRDSKGKIKHQESGKNLVVSKGENIASELLFIGAGTIVDHIALGSGTTTVLKSDTALATEIAASRTIKSSVSVIDNETTLEFSITAGGAWSMREAGLFDNAVGGNMLARFLTQAVDLTLGDIVDITWILTISGVD